MENQENEGYSGTEVKHPKQEFQVERLAFFSDAIFAIAITLLIIEFKVPHVTRESTYDQVLGELSELKYNFLALLFSFGLISMFWIRHHFLFKHIHNYNGPVIRLNMLIMLTIIFFPFTTTFYADSVENFAVFTLAFRLFALNNILAALSIFALSYYVFVAHKELSYSIPEHYKRKFFSDNLFLASMFILLLTLTFFTDSAKLLGGIACVTILVKNILERILKISHVKYS
ncbi:TMEM175 family protein [Elizabethkingia anophelis]|uniref:TMEM175 family protein n=1 Tax=Elizabethkingia anophelis TaxID=1117645 RepID=UPI0038912118